MKKKLIRFGALVCIISALLALSGCGGSSRNVAYDEDGFLGYSDDFWDWYLENN